MNGLSVIIPSKNGVNLRACLGAIRDNDPDVRCIVIDDGIGIFGCVAPDNMPPRTHIIPGIKPFVFARNMNLGIKAAGCDDIILLNDDAILKANDARYATSPLRGGGFTLMQRAQEGHPEYGIVSAAVIGPTNSQEHKPQSYPHMCELHPCWDLCSIRPVTRSNTGIAVPFVCVFMPRSTLDKVGLLDERFGGEINGERVYGGEDDDMCYRVRMAGLKIGIFDGCVVDHGTLQSTFRPDGRGLPINATRQRFRELHGFDMGTR